MGSPESERRVVVGTILRPHGIRGELKVAPLTFDPGRFRKGVRLLACLKDGTERDLVVDSVRELPDALLVRFAGIDAPEPAEALKGAGLQVPRSEARTPPPGQTLYCDMVGLEAVLEDDGASIGKVAAIISAGQDLLEIVRADGTEVLVPWVPEFVVQVDVPAGKVRIRPIPGLLEP